VAKKGANREKFGQQEKENAQGETGHISENKVHYCNESMQNSGVSKLLRLPQFWFG
jgi:hypothetical protein